jgi:hypothetical protein
MVGIKSMGWRGVVSHSKHCSHTCVFCACVLQSFVLYFNRLWAHTCELLLCEVRLQVLESEVFGALEEHKG